MFFGKTFQMESKKEQIENKNGKKMKKKKEKKETGKERRAELVC